MGLIKDLRNALLTSLAEKVAKYGFEGRVKEQSFYKRTPLGRLALHSSFIPHSADLDVTADVAVRFDDVETLVNQHKDYLSEGEKKRTFTLGAELGNIGQGSFLRWTLPSLDDVETVSEAIMTVFEAIGLPYLEKYSSMESALEVLSGDDKAAWLHSPFHNERAMRAIALAFLLGDRETFCRLAADKTEFLTSRKDQQGLEAFLKLKEALERKFSVPC
ncbi:MAG TPA: hypothetical protein VK747_03610 [Blastocatellia bacterium]|nr:hypothetical protein [Blastocatellia bacterium]